jgi:hypothetical protein
MMDTQDYIDLIDPTKPINPPATKTAPKPTSESVRVNFAAGKNALQSLLGLIGGLSSAGLSSLALTGISFTSSALITATDNALAALGKLQAQISLKQDALGFTAQDVAAKNTAGGYAGLDSGGYISITQLPDAIIHTLKFKGTFNGTIITSPDSSLNGLSAIPAASSSNEGFFFISIGSFTAFSTSYITGDWAISVGTSWQKIDNTDAISSFNGRLGAITLLDTDVLPLIPDASTTVKGLALLAGDSDAITGTNSTKSVTSHALAAKLADWLTNTLNATYAALSGATFTGAVVFSDQSVTQANISDCGVTVYAKGTISSTSTVTFNHTQGHIQTMTCGGAYTLTWAFSNFPPTGNRGYILVKATNMGAGTLAFSSTINWKLKNDTYTTTFSTYLTDRGGETALKAAGIDEFMFWSDDAGTTVYGVLL